MDSESFLYSISHPDVQTVKPTFEDWRKAEPPWSEINGFYIQPARKSESTDNPENSQKNSAAHEIVK